jgi:cellulose synthase/poly-beta-1,6-N-acetylglucosamine synthase-like glycosyltransferase
MKKLGQTAILVPAYNEAKVISHTLLALLKLTSAENIYVIDDGSSDSTKQTALQFTKNVFKTKNHGKAHALNLGIKHFKLTKNYKYIFFMDADTQPKPNFLEITIPHFEEDSGKKTICVVGQVKGIGTNWISKYRQWEYLISHLIHKKAQNIIQGILVVPGCATIYRSEIFEKLKFPSGTLTEDMDFTFLMHRLGYHNMVFDNRAVVYTQDPQDLKSFIKQISRWYTGFWQVVKKHNIPWQGQALDLEATMLALEGLYNGILILLFCISFIPFLIFDKLNIFTLPFLLDLCVFFIPTLVWSSIVDRDLKRLIYIPGFYFLRLLSSLIFLKSFFSGFLSYEKVYVWDSKRYEEVNNLWR